MAYKDTIKGQQMAKGIRIGELVYRSELTWGIRKDGYSHKDIDWRKGTL